MIVAFIAVLVGVLVAGPGPNLVYRWDAPADGSPVAHYVGELEVNGEVTVLEYIPDQEVVTPWPDRGTLRLRVAGVDSLGRQGDWSEWSVLFVDPGAPGAPGQPGRF